MSVYAPVVKNVPYHGREIDVVMILRDGPLEETSVVFAPTFHLLSLAKSSPSLATLKAAGADLKRFFECLEIAGLHWEDVSDNQMSGYIETTLIDQYKLSGKSIARNCTSIKGMYENLSALGISSKDFNFTFQYRTQKGETIEAISRQSNKFKLRQKYINSHLFETLLEHASPTSGFLRDRNELILEIGYQLGLRAGEVTHARNLKLEDIYPIVNLHNRNSRATCAIEIFGKRSKYRNIVIPPALLDRISFFIKKYEKTHLKDHLICNEAGEVLSSGFATKLFDQIKKRALPALKKQLSKLHDMDDAPYTIGWKSLSRLTFHALRHTCATNLVTYCIKNNIDPLPYVKEQLGHSDAKTTTQYINFQAAIYNLDRRRADYSFGDENDK